MLKNPPSLCELTLDGEWITTVDVQSLGLVQHYRQEEDVQLFCGMLDDLAFFPEEDVVEGMTYLR